MLILNVLSKIKDIFKGSYAFGILVEDEPDKIYATRKDSPLIIATNEEGNFIASDVPAILKHTNKYILLDNYDIAIIENDKINIYNNNKIVNKKINIFEYDLNTAMLDGYDHFMLKEINEQDKVVSSLLVAGSAW